MATKIRTWQERCQEFDDYRIISHQDIQNKMQEEIDELRTKYKGLASTLGKVNRAIEAKVRGEK